MTVWDNPTPGVNFSEQIVIPTTGLAGFYYINQSVSGAAESGAIEPTWNTDPVFHNAYTLDGSILWQETTDPAQLILSGILAPAAETVITLCVVGSDSPAVILEEGGNHGSDNYGPATESEEGNRFDRGGTNTEAQPGTFLQVLYHDGAWHPLLAVF